MGANPTQALGLAVFLISFVIISAALAMGGSLLLILLGIVLLGVAFGILLKAKPWEHIES
jgi:hypothetical protein